MRIVGFVLTAVGFLAGALIAVLDPERIALSLFLPALAVMAAGVGLARLAARREARDESKLEQSFAAIDGALVAIDDHATRLEEEKDDVDVYDLPDLIDERFPAHLEAFVEARHSIAHIWGAQAYADVMGPFAAGERYLHRAWSTAADGYIDEAHASLAQAREHLHAARAAFESLPHAAERKGAE